MDAIDIRGLHKSYHYGGREVAILSECSLTLPEDQDLVILGPSGSGKSTLLNILSLLDRPDHGSVSLLGIDYARAHENERRKFRESNIGFIFQSFHLVEELTVQQNISLPGHLKLTGNVKKRTKELLERVSLSHVKNHRPNTLSGGERQRVAVARALFHRPRFLFADEPTGNLDHQTGIEIMNLIRETCRESRSQMILVTHNESLIENSNYVVAIENGKTLAKEQY